MAGYENFTRDYRVAAGIAGKKGFEIGETSDSGPIPLHISFSLQKSDLETPNTGKITIWNLNKEHRSLLSKKNCVLSLRAGYDGNLSLIFAGAISTAITTMDGADLKTEIELVDGLINIRDTYISISYKGKVGWKRIFNDIAKKMGVAIVFSSKCKFKKVSNGFSFVGKASKVLDKGCKSCKLSWSIQNGVLQVKPKNSTLSVKGYELSKDTGMLGIPEKVVVSESDSGKKTMGYDVTYLLNGAINIDDKVKLVSDWAKGYFRVYSLDISGDNLSGDWICKARLLEVKKK